MKLVLQVAIGCIIALGLWKSSKENWVVALIPLFGVLFLIKYTNDLPFPIDLVVWVGAFAVYGVVASLVRDYRAKLSDRFKAEMAKAKAQKDNPQKAD